MAIPSVKWQINSFIQNNKTLCVCALGLVIVGYFFLDKRMVVWIKECLGTTKKTKDVTDKALPTTSENTTPTKPALLDVIEGGFRRTAQVPSIPFDATLLENVSVFEDYKIQLPNGYQDKEVRLTGLFHRPATLFFETLLKGTDFAFTRPGEGDEFCFYSVTEWNKIKNIKEKWVETIIQEDGSTRTLECSGVKQPATHLSAPHQKIREFLSQKAKDTPDEFVEFCAKGVESKINTGEKIIPIKDLGEILGNNTYRISYKEIWETVESQKIYTSALLPKVFYQGLKQALLDDQVTELPEDNPTLQSIKEGKNKSPTKTKRCQIFLNEVATRPLEYGFKSVTGFRLFMSLTLYQIGSMVVKTEIYHVFSDRDGKILERHPGQQDRIRLVNLCGLRPQGTTHHFSEINRQNMTELYKTALIAVESGVVIVPAVALGAWKGDPELYWKAFLDAVLERSDHLEHILVNPSHKEAPDSSKYKGKKGEEFAEILTEYRHNLSDKPEKLKKLDKIFNLLPYKCDGFQLARKLTGPDKIPSLINAGDPDGTLGHLVGQYTNNWPHTKATTDEHGAALGSTCLCFEGITGVHQDPTRVIQT